MTQNDNTASTSRRKFLTMGGMAAASGAMLAAINAAALGQTNELSPSIPGVKADGEPIPIGGGVPLTGWAAADGIEFKRALEMACDEINAMGGILGRPVQPVFEDTKEQGADNIIPAMQRLIDRHGVHAIINGYNTGAVTQEYDVIADAASSTSTTTPTSSTTRRWATIRRSISAFSWATPPNTGMAKACSPS